MLAGRQDGKRKRKLTKLSDCKNQLEIKNIFEKYKISLPDTVIQSFLKRTKTGDCLDPIQQYQKYIGKRLRKERKERKVGDNAGDKVAKLFQRTGNAAYYNITERKKDPSWIPKAYQNWSQKQSIDKRAAKLAGLMGISIWTRDDKVIVILGERHDVYGLSRCLKNGGEPFMKWFLRTFVSLSDRASDRNFVWDVFVESFTPRVSPTRINRKNPLFEVQAYAVAKKCFAPPPGFALLPEGKWASKSCSSNLRFHYFDWRPDAFRQFIFDEPNDAYLLGLKQWIKELPSTILYLRAILVKQIQKVSSTDQTNLVRLLQDFDKRNRELLKFLQDELHNIASLVQEYQAGKSTLWYQFQTALFSKVFHFSDFYALARLLKTYMHQIVIICGDNHRKEIDNLLPEFGFHLEYKAVNPKEESCLSEVIIPQW